ncbi:conserved hypothetical protein [Burkholderia mallei PRL-20]|uniref:Uncharacterized protein n=1 Tax=Burkholderia pseudomallei 1710a TaxID=320371 RepID=A0A0E1W5T2_BURPE|nr:hypothetical protein BMASAVP1_1495 [Burkholderia mallei SAVP1]ABO01788.1 hypothetical protein BMA10247_A0348 [Burkholderia mallei NCTC 10247]EBA50483.1 hypothetical protein BURPS305_5948 [Burkholderia pseudomallei 305]EDK58148.1 hypothetical protein BMAJHU_E0280 [Burkholderia mallei JHU]EDK86567.1 hypothetical protein BMA721280_I0201 [Burkholderia mallei 2002721280]EDP88305.1 hypothetical protein BMA10399_K0177 [Burkholderia mallei ATCC 10399]EDU12480.1 hypothetical protein BURPS1655_D1379
MPIMRDKPDASRSASSHPFSSESKRFQVELPGVRVRHSR